MTPVKLGFHELLSKFKDDDIFSLAKTVTQGLLKNKINSRNEAIDAIIHYSTDEVSFLRRKILTREILFSYLHDKQIPVSVPITKNELIDKILEYWNSLSVRQQYETPHTSTVILDSREQDGQEERINYKNINTTENILSNNSMTSYGENQITTQQTTIGKLAEQFTTWFYSMMNENHCISSEHFYPDAKLKLNLINNDDCNTQVIENSADEVVQVLFQTKLQHNLFFNPNISKEGVQGRMNPHGLVMVMACGTLHVDNICAGVFEQVFALSRDPFSDNNWKIKNTELNLRSKNSVIGPPSLCDSELTSELLALPTS